MDSTEDIAQWGSVHSFMLKERKEGKKAIRILEPFCLTSSCFSWSRQHSEIDGQYATLNEPNAAQMNAWLL